MIDAELLIKILEAALMTANKPMNIQQIQQLFEKDAPDKNKMKAALMTIAERCDQRGIELVEVASGWRFQVKQEVAHWVGRLFEEKPQKYSRAALETLALIAYRQPVTRGEIEEVRGVAVSSQIIRSLQEREWVKVVGHRDVPGRPAMYATTREFLDYLGIKSLENLPALADIRDLDALNQELDLKVPEELINAIEGSEASNDEGAQDMAASSNEDVLPDEDDLSSDTAEQVAVSAEGEGTANNALDADNINPANFESKARSELIPIVAVDSESSEVTTVSEAEIMPVFEDHTAEDMAVIDALNAEMADKMTVGAFDRGDDVIHLDEEVNEQALPDDERDQH